VAVDSTTLEANAAMKSIIRRDTGEDWKAYVTRLMHEAGTLPADEQPSDEEIRRFDQRRKNKRVSNDQWVSTSDAESSITQMKDGTTHLAYKAEHVVDLESEFVLAATVYGGDRADTDTLCDSLVDAQLNLDAAGSDTQIQEAVADKGYHAAATIELCDSLDFRTYIPEPKRPHRLRWTDKPPEYRDAVYGNRRRVKGNRSKRLQRLRSELVERSFAHVCETGGARRCWLRGLANVTKRYLLQAAARNLGLILRKLFGMGTPRGLQTAGPLATLVHFIMIVVERASILHDAIRRVDTTINLVVTNRRPVHALAA
jgi:hypothetical protein